MIVESEVGGWRLIDWRPRNLRVLSFRSAVDAEREGLHVEVKAADRAAIEQFERPGPEPGTWPVGRGGLEVSGGASRLRDRCCRGRYPVGSRARAPRVRRQLTGQGGHPGGTGLRVDPRGTEAPPARDAAAAVGGVHRRARCRGLPAQRLLPDLPGLGAAAEALDAPAAFCRREDVRR